MASRPFLISFNFSSLVWTRKSQVKSESLGGPNDSHMHIYACISLLRFDSIGESRRGFYNMVKSSWTSSCLHCVSGIRSRLDGQPGPGAIGLTMTHLSRILCPAKGVKNASGVPNFIGGELVASENGVLQQHQSRAQVTIDSLSVSRQMHPEQVEPLWVTKRISRA
jgi:hypothetical protein